MAAIDFHHRDPKLKSFSISRKIDKVGRMLLLQDLKEELDKCDVLCKNCHTELHHKEN